ncbi:MAG: thioredoxin family protein [Rhodobacteraceae bacterium]|nr:thioredoxin family protein [Paracoccaceae bacterium]
MQIIKSVALAAVIAASLAGSALAELQLLMFEQAGCIYCEQWHADVGPEYPLTSEGKAAPLVPVQLRAKLPEGITVNSPPVFTPTFVLLQNGVEVSRIEGYPGEDFFWGLLSAMIKDAAPSQ